MDGDGVTYEKACQVKRLLASARSTSPVRMARPYTLAEWGVVGGFRFRVACPIESGWHPLVYRPRDRGCLWGIHAVGLGRAYAPNRLPLRGGAERDED